MFCGNNGGGGGAAHDDVVVVALWRCGDVVMGGLRLEITSVYSELFGKAPINQ